MPPATDPPRNRRRAVSIAGHAGDEPTARRGLHDPDPSVRIAAIGALARLDRLGVDDLGTALRDPESSVRARSAELAPSAGPGANELLVDALADNEPAVVEAAAFAMGELGGRGPSVDALSQIARDHRDPLCREAAVAALGAIGDPAGLAAILDATTDKPAVRRRAVLALAPFSGADVDGALERALNDRDWQVRQAAEDLTGRRPTS